MSFDDYVNHIAQKIRLATAIGILKTKPKNISTKRYIEELRKNLGHMDYDSDVTVCSDDFDADCDDVTVTNNYNDSEINPVIRDDNTHNDVDHNKSVIDNDIHNVDNTDVVYHENNAFEGVLNHITDNEVYNDISNIIQIDSQKSIHDINILDMNFETNKDELNDKTNDIFNIINDLKTNAVIEMPNRPQLHTHESQKHIANEEPDSDATFCESALPQNNDLRHVNNDFETQIYTLSDFSQFKTHYSESQIEKIDVDSKFIYNKTERNVQKPDMVNPNAAETEFSQYAQNITGYELNTNIDNNFNTEKDDLNQKHINNDTTDHRHDTVDTDKSDHPNDNNIDNHSNDSNDCLTDSQREVVPFKILEELNKIKMYLKKRNERRMSYEGSDSGYRSDSQGRTSRNSLQLSGSSLNQSAHSLLTFITNCPLISATSEITKEISRALGSLIDRLHEEESYPWFLEVLLDTIAELLKSIHEDDSVIKLLSKDEKVQRVLLLNKSSHVQKYTIDKITDILQTIDTTDAYEINHTAKMENLCYVFYILEIILSKRRTTEESSQPSQEKILKKSSITDIWRKKWNLTKQVAIDNVEKKCALTKCSEVLNKMIVDCMDGYSLVSFIALKCFNLLQPS